MKPRACPVCGSEQIKAQPKLKSDIPPPRTYRCERGHVFVVSKAATAAAS